LQAQYVWDPLGHGGYLSWLLRSFLGAAYIDWRGGAMGQTEGGDYAIHNYKRLVCRGEIPLV
jgi:hypothetical protein